MNVPLLDLKTQHNALQSEIEAALSKVLSDARFILGPNVAALEEEIAAFCGAQYGIGVASGTDALWLSLLAAGVQAGDEVITTPFTFTATASSITFVGAAPIFADLQEGTYNLDSQEVAKRITPRTKAIIPAHLYGLPVEMGPILEIAKAHGLAVIEDAAQAIGARCQGKPVGSLGDTGCFSFYPTKNLGGCGDGGMVVTNNHHTAQQIKLLRDQADQSIVGGAKYTYQRIGYNSRLDEMQAAILRIKLRRLPEWTARRTEMAMRYHETLFGSGLTLPSTPVNHTHAWHLYTVRTPERDRLKAHLERDGIGSAIYYPAPLHLQPCYRHLGYREGDFPVAERASREVLSIPIFPEMTDAQQQAVIESIRRFAEDYPASLQGVGLAS